MSSMNRMRNLLRVTTSSVLLLILLLAGETLAQLSPREIYQKNSDSVVLIISKNSDKTRSKGTGSIIDDGLVLTNAHVVLENSGEYPSQIFVYLKKDNLNDDSQRAYKKGRRARIIKSNIELDLAILKVEQISGISPIGFADSDQVMVGDAVLAIGHPENGGMWSLTSGRIGTLIKNQGGVHGKHVFQTETSLNRGNSGGPLLDGYGMMVGVNTSIARVSKDGLAITGINFAVQSNVARKWLSKGAFSITSRQQNKHRKSQAEIRKKKSEKKVDQTASRKQQKTHLDSLPDNTVLTPVRPFKNDDLFMLFDEKEEAFDNLMDSQMGETSTQRG